MVNEESRRWPAGEALPGIRYRHNSHVAFRDEAGARVEGWIVAVLPATSEPVYTVERVDGMGDHKIPEPAVQVIHDPPGDPGLMSSGAPQVGRIPNLAPGTTNRRSMFGRKNRGRAITPPPIAGSDPAAVEVLRVWASPGAPQQVTLIPYWKDPGAWGLLIADVARHAANAYARKGEDPEEVLLRIRELFDAEWSSPTDQALDLTDEAT